MKLSKILTVTSLAAVLALSASSLMAQDNNNERRRNREGGPGNFDPAEMQARMMERTKETLEITDETEWKAIEPLVAKVMEARREQVTANFRGMGRGGRGGGDNNDRGGRAGGFFGTPSPEAEALQRAIDGKASNSEIKAALAKFEAARKAKLAVLEKAQAELRKVLTPRQEAIAAMNGLL
jgi:Spy/CpxP family protein refolding chaperone